jgi:hypothetical protein
MQAADLMTYCGALPVPSAFPQTDCQTAVKIISAGTQLPLSRLGRYLSAALCEPNPLPSGTFNQYISDVSLEVSRNVQEELYLQ